MPTPYLHGNHILCPNCELRRDAEDVCPIYRNPIPCNQCGGAGYLPLTSAEIIGQMREDAARWHWPAFDRACGISPHPSLARCDQGGSNSLREDGDNTGCGGVS